VPGGSQRLDSEQEFDNRSRRIRSVSWFARLRASLGKAREAFSAVGRLGRPGAPLTAEFWDELEETLILADFGVPTTQKIVTGLQTVAKQEAWKTADRAVARFRKDVERFLSLPGAELRLDRRPAVVLVVGVNGSGKTTTIGKLATRLRTDGKRVLMVAGDTFRAAAAEQLAIWAQRSGSELIRGAEGADPASVVFDGIKAGMARNADVILIDTAGRLQTKTNLMEELKKMRRIVERECGGPPAETLLVLDGTTGQNAISQAKLFHEAAQLTGVVVTKLDSSAKGGVLVAIVDELEIPIKFIGLGESADALRPFVPAEFTQALFDEAPDSLNV
jgi:fused signal recognition particle receptor